MARSHAGVQRGALLVGLVASLLVVAAPFGGEIAHACSCMEETDEQSFARADAVFVGEVLEFERGPLVDADGMGVGKSTYRVRVTALMKGDAAAEQVVVTPSQSTACALEMLREGPYLVYAYSHGDGLLTLEPGELMSHECSGTRLATPNDAARRDASLDGETSPIVPASSSAWWIVWPAAGTALLVAIVIGLVGVRRRARTSSEK